MLILLLGVWCLIDGILQIYFALTMARKATLRAVIGMSGALSLIVGLIFILAPGDGALALIWLIGVFVTAYGILRVGNGLAYRHYYRKERIR